jgi:hypothetical protein
MRALAADELTLDKSDTYVACGECHGTVLARRAGADDDDVVVGDVGSSFPASSAIMYVVYQWANFPSACPIRFSCPPCAAAARRRRAPQRVIEREVGIEPHPSLE